MYQENIANIEKEDLFKIPVGLLRSDDGMLFFYPKRELHEILAREICSEFNKDFQKAGYISAVDFLLEKEGFIKLSNYGTGKSFRCITAHSKAMHRKSVREWFEIITSSLNLRPDVY